MNRSEFIHRLKAGLLILDGATGSELQQRGMPRGACPEQWILEHPHVLLEVQRAYARAGAQVLYTCTFGCNPPKLAGFDLAEHTRSMNRDLARLSRRAAGDTVLVAGDLAPTGRFIEPTGDMSFEAAVAAYREQVLGLVEGGVDFLVIETMMDIQEARAALIAARENCDLPVCVCMTFDETGRTLTGTDPLTALITLQSLGADVVGCNCSTGPDAMLDVVHAIKPYSRVPLMAKPNAGLPKLVRGETRFDMAPDTFATGAGALVDAGVSMVGGCCGTTPDHIRALREKAPAAPPPFCEPEHIAAVTSPRKTVFLGPGQPFATIGERINPTGKKKLKAELRGGQTHEVRRLALEQAGSGATLLDVNVGASGVDEADLLVKSVDMLAPLIDQPLCLDSSSPEAVESALRVYPGRALINSISGERAKLERLLPIAAKYGAMFILLPLDDDGIPAGAEARARVVQTVLDAAAEYGYDDADVVVDGLVMTVSSDPSAAAETLKLIEWAGLERRLPTVLGISNVSFGLPQRKWVNAAFLAMAAAKGLSCAIANPTNDVLMNVGAAANVLTGRDRGCEHYIGRFTEQAEADAAEAAEERTSPEKAYDAVVRGHQEGVVAVVEEALAAGVEPEKLVDHFLIPAITEVGHRFDRKEYFLPQLIMSAETMKRAFDFLEPHLSTDSGDSAARKVVLATVKGDIHDIGKNIVALMLKNYGFTVIDLGKDVERGDIVAAVEAEDARLVGLSALMTTTMTEMEAVVKTLRQDVPECRIMIGGAVVDQNFADQIGADGYADNAHTAVSLAQSLLGVDQRAVAGAS